MSAPNNAENRELRSRSNKAKAGPNGVGAEGECETYPESHEGRECPVLPASLVYPVSPVSRGQEVNGKLENELQSLATSNACMDAKDVPEEKRFKLARDIRGLEERRGQELTAGEVTETCTQWHWLSGSYAGNTCAYHLENLLAELTKVRVPTGEGNTLNKALEAVSRLSVSELPSMPGLPEADEARRRLLALHRELARLSTSGKYFLSYRDAAKVHHSLSHQDAHTITHAFARLGMIKLVSKGKAGVNSRKAAEFRNLLPDTAKAA